MFINKLSTCLYKLLVNKIKIPSNNHVLRSFQSNKGALNLTHSKMVAKSCIKLDETVISSGFLDSFDYVLTDCDGVLWNEMEPIPGSIETVDALKKLGKQVLYVTNNSTKTREEFVKKCENLGFPATLNDIVSTAYCAATYLKSLNFQKKVYIFGGTGIAHELEKVNIRHLSTGPDNVPDDWIQWLKEVELDPEVGAVVIGFDYYVSYPKLTKAASYLRKPETLFIATNRDESVTKHGMTVPCTGGLVSAVEVVTGRKALTLGKPERYILECAKYNYPDMDSSRCIMIGDRLNTDILFGSKNGIRTLFVLTGNNTLEDVQYCMNSSDASDLELVPDYYLPCLGDLKKMLI